METNRIFTRAEIKQRAKESLKGRWGLPIGSYLLTLAITYFLTFVVGLIFAFIATPFIFLLGGVESVITLTLLLLIPLFLVVILAISPLSYGMYSIYIKISRNEPTNIGDLFKPYKYMWKIIGLSLLIGLKTFLWSLLFIVPGIIAAYRYSQAPYILIDNPEKSISQCINESCEMMRGKKADLFVLYLSFLGWMLLIIIPANIINAITHIQILGNLISMVGSLFLSPYLGVTYANFYNQLANKVPTGMEDFDIDENGFYNQDQVTQAVFTQDEFAVAGDEFAVAEPEATVEAEPVTESEQEYGFEIKEDN